jgi:hypothetical protein
VLETAGVDDGMTRPLGEVCLEGSEWAWDPS